MRKSREIIGLPVICLDTGKQVGIVEDLQWDHHHGEVTGLLVHGNGLISKIQLIPYRSIASIGSDAVTLNGDFEDIDDEMAASGTGSGQLAGCPVLSEQGQNLGTIEDVVFQTSDGELVGYEMSTGLVGDLLSGRRLLPLEDILTWGDQAVIVKEKDSKTRGKNNAVSYLPE